MQRILMIQTQQVERHKARMTYVGGQLYMAADIPEADEWVAQGIAEDPDAPKPAPTAEVLPEFAAGGFVEARTMAMLGAHDPTEVVLPLEALPQGKPPAGPNETGGGAGPADEGGNS